VILPVWVFVLWFIQKGLSSLYTAKLISLSKPTEDFFVETGAECAEDLISFCARVSNPSNQENFDTAAGLLSYCMKQHHWSIFEMCNAVLEIECTRDIGRQILRHRSFSYQEFSQRYAAVLADPVIRECRFQDTKNRQNSIEWNIDDPEQVRIAVEWNTRQQRVWDVANEEYKWALVNKLAKEQARVVLPEGMTPSTMYMNGTVRSWIHYCMLRRDNGTQKEHRQVAESVWNIMTQEFKFLEKVK
jgi:thymidylate synthase (FAD)